MVGANDVFVVMRQWVHVKTCDKAHFVNTFSLSDLEPTGYHFDRFIDQSVQRRSFIDDLTGMILKSDLKNYKIATIIDIIFWRGILFLSETEKYTLYRFSPRPL